MIIYILLQLYRIYIVLLNKILWVVWVLWNHTGMLLGHKWVSLWSSQRVALTADIALVCITWTCYPGVNWSQRHHTDMLLVCRKRLCKSYIHVTRHERVNLRLKLIKISNLFYTFWYFSIIGKWLHSLAISIPRTDNNIIQFVTRCSWAIHVYCYNYTRLGTTRLKFLFHFFALNHNLKFLNITIEKRFKTSDCLSSEK